MNIGDVLELIGGGCLVAAGALYLGWPLALLVSGLFLLYLAQCYVDPIHLPRRFRRLQRKTPDE